MKKSYFTFLIVIFFTVTVAAQQEEGISFKKNGKVKPRHSNDIASNNWAIGGETMDRDYSTYEYWKEYLGPLGAKKIRLQAGNIISIFDHSLERIKNYLYATDTELSLSLYAYQTKNFDYQAVTIWENSDTPNNSVEKTLISFEFPKGNFENPVYVDMRTGNVFEIPVSNYKREGTFYKFSDIPVYDSPILIADKKLINLTDKTQ